MSGAVLLAVLNGRLWELSRINQAVSTDVSEFTGFRIPPSSGNWAFAPGECFDHGPLGSTCVNADIIHFLK